MPCNSGDDSYNFGWNDAKDVVAEETASLRERVAELEQALCGLCQMYVAHRDKPNTVLHPQLKAWFDKHMAQPGCVAKEGE